MKCEEGSFRATGGVELFCRSWRPDAGAPRGAVCIVHGVGEHSGRYGNIAQPLAERGYAVHAYDQRGHGRSPGPRVHVGRWSEYREDLAEFLSLAARREPGAPLFLYGHSMGALVVLDRLLNGAPGVRGAVVSGAPVELAGAARTFRIAMARLLSRVWPRCTLDLGLNPDDLSRDASVVSDYETDPLVVRRATARWCAEFLDTVARVRARAVALDLPLLLLHGGGDRINFPRGAETLLEAIRHPDRALRVYPGGRHEPHNEPGHEQVAADVAQWLDGHV